MRDAADAGGRPRHYHVVEAERVDADRETAFLRFLSHDPNYAARWLKDLNRAIAQLPDFPGPLSHAIDERASVLYGREVRRMLYYGPTRRRSGTPYRVLFTVIHPAEEGDETVIRVLRILHGAQEIGGREPGEEGEAA